MDSVFDRRVGGTARITHDRLKERLNYDPETGVFVWRYCEGMADEFNETYPGRSAGKLNRDGYIEITVDGRRYLAHRLAWFYVHGEWPPDDMVVDHKNRFKTDNYIENLRLATQQQNCINRGASRNSKSGIKGVSFDDSKQKWIARMTIDGEPTILGEYSTKEAAAWSRQFREVGLYGEFAYINRDIFGDIGAP